MSVSVKLDAGSLRGPIVHDLCAAGSSPAKAVATALRAHLQDRIEAALRERLVKSPLCPVNSTARSGAATLPALAAGGYETYYLEAKFSTAPGDVIDALDVKATGIELVALNYGHGVSIASQVKAKRLKTQTNHVLRLNHVRVPGAFFAGILRSVRAEGGVDQPLLANFHPDQTVQHLVAFDHMLDGSRCFCRCAEGYHRTRLGEAREVQHRFVPDSWPHRTRALLDGAKYVDGLCHLCVARSHSDEELMRRYGSDFEREFEAYVPQVAFDMGVDTKTAREKVKELFGLSRWVREAQLYRVLQALFPDHTVLREASPPWLGRMRLDMYLPGLALAVEHQGEQHFRPIAAFGGDAAHAQVLARDKAKRDLCRRNGVHLVDVRFDAPISAAAMRKRLERFLP